MEKQKIFWVVLSVSVFVVVVLVVGVFLLKQKPYSGLTSAPGTVSPISDLGTQVYEYQREPAAPRPGAGTSGGAPGNGAPAGGTAPENTQTMHFYIGEGGEKPGGPELPPRTTPPAVSAQPAGPQKPALTQAVPKQVTPPAQVARPVAKVLPKSAPIKAPVQTRTARRTVDYWIQTGSYKSQTKAEELAALLSGKGLSARLFTNTSGNGTYYRVRIGPYGNKGEADKFLSIVKQIQGLESSYLSMVGSARNLN
jgi:cell division septation protein DedD